jgi:hypothetical protein
MREREREGTGKRTIHTRFLARCWGNPDWTYSRRHVRQMTVNIENRHTRTRTGLAPGYILLGGVQLLEKSSQKTCTYKTMATAPCRSDTGALTKKPLFGENGNGVMQQRRDPREVITRIEWRCTLGPILKSTFVSNARSTRFLAIGPDPNPTFNCNSYDIPNRK